MDYFTPLSLLLFTTFVLFIFGLCKWDISRSPSKSGRLPPSPTAFPIVGHLHLLTDMPHHTFTRLAHQLGPLVYLRLGQVPTVVVSSSHLARLVLKTHDHIFASRPQLVGPRYLSFGCSDVTFSTYSPYWRQVRKICVSELLSSKRVNSFQLVREEEVNWMLDSLLTRSRSEVDLRKLFSTLTNDILCRVAFGRRFTAEEGPIGKLVRAFEGSEALFAGFCVGDYFPEWKWVNSVSGLNRKLEKGMKELREACNEIIDEHNNNNNNNNNNGSDSTRREDFVDVLLRVHRRQDLEVPITDDNLKALMLDMFVAGTDTTSNALEWTMTELARNPRVLKKAQEEVRKVVSHAEKVDETHLQHLRYIKAVVKEAMRLHPPAPLLIPRESMEECNLDGYRIPAKTRVLINAYAIGRDPQSWEDPLVYNPERFEDDSNIDVKDQEYNFLPFGGGRRGCPGSAFGLATLEIALARLLFHFDWELPQGVGPQDVDTDESFGLVTFKKSALVLVPITNKNYEFKGM